MTANHTHTKIFQMIAHAEKILLLTDERIDGDTTGSTMAMFHYLKSAGKNVRVFSPKDWAESYKIVPGGDHVLRDAATFKEGADLMMIFDCSDGAYLTEFLPLLPRPVPLVVFDHHATNPLYGDVNLVDVSASSTGEVVWRFFKSNKIAINRDMATSLLVAICTDTTLFTNSATNQVCMEAAAELGLAGAKMQDIVKTFYMNRSIHALQLWGRALERLFELPNRAVVTVVTMKDREETGASEEDIHGIANFLITMVEGSTMVCVLYEKEDGSVKASLRTLDGDVAALAQKMGGGGHIKAAGFAVPQARLEEGASGWRIMKQDGSYLVISEILR